MDETSFIRYSYFSPRKDCRHKIKEHPICQGYSQNDIFGVDDSVTHIKLFVIREYHRKRECVPKLHKLDHNNNDSRIASPE